MFRCRPFHLFLLVFEFIWLGIVIPVHTRGIVSMGDTCPNCVARESHCPHCHPGKNEPAPHQDQGCAICNFAMHLTLPPLYDCRPAALGVVELLPIARPESFISRTHYNANRDRAPPAIA